MSYEEIVETKDNWRVKIEIDECPEEPYDDGQSPLIRIDRSGSYWRDRAEHKMVGARPTDDDERIEEAASKWASELDLFEKYLRAYQGATQVVRWDSQDYIYISYDTPRWRNYVGFDDSKDLPLKDGCVNLNEYRAWCEGDVWSLVIEKKVTWSTDDEDFDDKDEWEEVSESAVGGFYGQNWAEEAAREELENWSK